VCVHIPEQIVKPPFSLALVRRVIPQLDIIGFVFFAPAAILLLLALQFGSGNTYAWDSPVIIGLFVGAGVAVILFLLWEWKAGDVAIIPFSMVSNRIVWTSTLQYISLIAAIFVGTSYFPIYFQAVSGVGPVLSGVYILPSILSQLFFVLAGGVLSEWNPFILMATALLVCVMSSENTNVRQSPRWAITFLLPFLLASEPRSEPG
jgi:hypothetical protein